MRETLEAARTLLKANLFRDSISRAYYAVFHAAVTVLLSQGLEAKSHRGVNALFSLHFVQTGKIDRKHLRLLSKTQKFREEADYNAEIDFNQADAEETLKDAEIFCLEMSHFLQKEGYEVS